MVIGNITILPLLWGACSGPPTRLAVSPRPIFVTILDDSARKRGKKAYKICIAGSSNKANVQNTKKEIPYLKVTEKIRIYNICS